MIHRILLIGHGGISESYIKVITAIPNAIICGVIGRSIDNVSRFANKHGIAVYGTVLKEVARRAEATAAIICTPNSLHNEGVTDAAAIGLHCLCEKPLHISPEIQQAMIAKCKENGVKLAVSYMRRFSTHFQAVKQLMNSGVLGRITVVDVMIRHYRTKAYYEGWHGTKEMDGGGPFMQQGSHIIDLALWLCGGFREVLQAKRFQVLHEIETEDHGYAVIAYTNGAVGLIEASTACVEVSEERIVITGTKGTITANYEGIIQFKLEEGQPDVPMPSHDKADNETLMRRLVSDFLLSIEEDRLPFVDGESGALASGLVEEIYRQAGEPIKTFI